MGKFLVKFLAPGMKISKAIYDEDGTLLFPQGITINQEVLDELSAKQIYVIYVDSPKPSIRHIKHRPLINTNVPEVLSLETKNEAMRNVESIVSSISQGEDFAIEDTKAVATDMVAQITANKDAMINLIDLKAYDDYTFAHSVNIAVLATVIGKELGLGESALFDLALGGILHDIGKMLVNEEILNKKGRLTKDEFFEMMKHPAYSYRLLMGKDMSDAARLIPIEHHEWVDGSGYPRHLCRDQISLYGRIAAIADVYDALTAERVYKTGMSPYQAIKIITSETGRHFDSEIAKTFIQRLTLYPVNTVVQLSDERYGMVIANRKHNMILPKLRLLRLNPDGGFSDSGDNLDLHLQSTVFIKSVIEAGNLEVIDNHKFYNK